MKKIYILLLALLIIVFGIPLSTNADPYVGADITLNGADFSGIWEHSDDNPGEFDPDPWFIEGTTIWSGVSTVIGDPNTWRVWVEYTAKLKPGIWLIGLNAINIKIDPDCLGLNPDPDWYPYFEVKACIVAKDACIPNTETILNVPASDTVVNYDYFPYDASGGPLTVRFEWMNDKTEGTLPSGLPLYDANLNIISVFFDRLDYQGGGCGNYTAQ